MRMHVAKWGNSLAVRIPRAFADQLGVQEGSSLEATATGDALVLRKQTYTLDDLVAGITDDNRHAEIDTGKAIGREAW